MARTNVVKSARKAQGKCRVCSKEINVGDPYKWAKPRYGSKVVVCSGCQITASMTSSSKLVAVWEAQEALSFSEDDLEAIAADLRSLAETAREVGQEYQDSCDNQREYFPDSETAQENEDKAQGLDGWADELDAAADDVDNLQSEIDDLQAELAALDNDSEDFDEETERIEGEIQEKREEAVGDADEISSNCPA